MSFFRELTKPFRKPRAFFASASRGWDKATDYLGPLGKIAKASPLSIALAAAGGRSVRTRFDTLFQTGLSALGAAYGIPPDLLAQIYSPAGSLIRGESVRGELERQAAEATRYVKEFGAKLAQDKISEVQARINAGLPPWVQVGARRLLGSQLI